MVSCSSMGVLFWVPLLLKAMLAGDFGGHAAGGHSAPAPPLPPAHCGDREQARRWRLARPEPWCAARRTAAGGLCCSALRLSGSEDSCLGSGPAYKPALLTWPAVPRPAGGATARTEDQGTGSGRGLTPCCAAQAWGTARLALLSGLLFLPCAVLQLANAWSAKRFRERNLHAGLPVALSGVAFMRAPHFLPHACC